MAIAPDDPVFDIKTLLDRLNAVCRPRRNRQGLLVPRWNRWSLTRQLQRRGVQLVQLVPGGKFWFTLRALRDAFPELWEELLDQEALRGIAA